MIVAARSEAPHESLEAIWQRAGVPPAAIEKLADVDAFHSLAQTAARQSGGSRVSATTPCPFLPLRMCAMESPVRKLPNRWLPWSR
jgi:error-prone DNA polymerase